MLALFSCGLFFGQDVPTNDLTPSGVLDNIFDRYGRQYKLNDIIINEQNTLSENISPLIVCSTTSKFNLFFEPGCGMSSLTNITQISRRQVLCQVFQDLSDFLISQPLTLSGKKVNIWVRNINNVTTTPNNVLGFASGFYVLPSHTTKGGIADNEIWKTIHTGQDSYTNVTIPLSNAGNGTFYHGMVSFNFNDTDAPIIPNTNPIFWNTNLTTSNITSPNTYDLYSAVLHEIVHALGFESLINENGNSKFGSNFKYYSRYDKFLKENSTNKFLIKSNATCAIEPMYNFEFNNLLNNSILKPQTSPPTACNNITSCNDAIKYVGTTFTVPVFTPKCFSNISSLSHFEDALFPSCSSPNGDDAYFLMCNAGVAGTVRRYLKPEERQTLCDIGYKVNTSYGSIATSNGFYNYSGSPVCNGIIVSGINDGINASLGYSFRGFATATSPIIISNLLANDINATRFECLEDLTATLALQTTLSITSGILGNNIEFRSSLVGLHLLRYIPINGSQSGNITYVYVYVNAPLLTNSCTPTPSICNLVNNGDFEQNNGNPPNNFCYSNNFEFEKACGWSRLTNLNTPDYYFQSPAAGLVNVPCNALGFQNDNVTGNRGYVGMYSSVYNNIISSEIIATKLQTPLLPNSRYQLKFDVSLAEYISARAFKLQAMISTADISTVAGATNGSSIPQFIYNNNLHYETANVVNNSTGWETITFNIVTDVNVAGQEYLYLGGLYQPPNQVNAPAQIITACPNQFNNPNETGKAYYYFDNIRLTQIDGTFTLPATIVCSPQLLPDLSIYVFNLPVPSATNTFSLFSQPTSSGSTINTVKRFLGKWRFDTVGLISGNYTIRYTYTDAVGCVKTIDSTIFLELCDVLFANVRADATQYNLGCKFLGSTQTAYIFQNCTINGLVATYPRAFATQVSALIAGVSISPDGYLAIGSNVLPGNYIIQYKICQTSQPLNCSNTASFAFTISPRIQANDDDVFVDPFSNMRQFDGTFLGRFEACKNDFLQCNVLNLADVVLSAVTINPNFSLNLTTGQITLANNLAINSTHSMIYKISLVSNPTIFSTATINVTIAYTMGLGANFRVLTTDYINGASPKILITGDFTTFSGINRKNIASLNQSDLNQGPLFYATANLGPTHATLTTNLIHKVCVDGSSTFLGGQFTGYTGSPSSRIVKIATSNGIKDMSFGASTNNTVYDIKKIPVTNQILVSGSFNNTYGSGIKQGIARLNSVTGALDTSFNNTGAGANGIIDCMAIQANGRIIITGNFTYYNGTPTGAGIARLMPDGTLDTTFNVGGTGFNNVIVAGATEANIKKIMLDTNQNIFICGRFDAYNGSQAQNIVKIKPDGSNEGAFIGKASGKINDMTFDSTSTKLYIGGQFSGYNGLLEPANRRLIRISKIDGTRDTSFSQILLTNQFNNIVYTTTMQPDGRLIVGGSFTEYNGYPANNITRINTSTHNQGKAQNNTSTNSNLLNEIFIYPNPNKGIFYIDLANDLNSFNDIEIYNVLGQKIYSKKAVDKINNEIDISNCADGIYIVRLLNDLNAFEYKIIKQ